MRMPFVQPFYLVSKLGKLSTNRLIVENTKLGSIPNFLTEHRYHLCLVLISRFPEKRLPVAAASIFRFRNKSCLFRIAKNGVIQFEEFVTEDFDFSIRYSGQN